MQLTLVSYKICPVCSQSSICIVLQKYTIRHKKNYVYIDLNERPDWFNKISPLEKVPILIIGQNKVLFESNVILDYVDARSPPSLHPNDPFERALARAKQEFAGEIQQTLSAFKYSKTNERIEELKADLKWYFERLEALLTHRYLLGDQVSLADFSFAPIFTQIQAQALLYKFDAYEGFPKIRQYGVELLSLDASLMLGLKQIFAFIDEGVRGLFS